jgi:hypothetical protein
LLQTFNREGMAGRTIVRGRLKVSIAPHQCRQKAAISDPPVIARPRRSRA